MKGDLKTVIGDVLPEDEDRKTYSNLDIVAMRDAKQFRYDLTRLLDRMEDSTQWHPDEERSGNHPSQERFEAIKKVKEAIHWLGSDLNKITAQK